MVPTTRMSWKRARSGSWDPSMADTSAAALSDPEQWTQLSHAPLHFRPIRCETINASRRCRIWLYCFHNNRKCKSILCLASSVKHYWGVGRGPILFCVAVVRSSPRYLLFPCVNMPQSTCPFWGWALRCFQLLLWCIMLLWAFFDRSLLLAVVNDKAGCYEEC